MYPGTLEDTSSLYHMNHFLQPAERSFTKKQSLLERHLKNHYLKFFLEALPFFFFNHLYTVLHNSSGVQYMQQNIPVEYKILFLKPSSLEFLKSKL